MKGRKRKNYRAERISIYCTDMDAYNILKKMNVNLSELFTDAIRERAYSPKGNQLVDKALQRDILITQMRTLQRERDAKIEEVNIHYALKLKALAEKINKLTTLIAEEEVEESR